MTDDATGIRVGREGDGAVVTVTLDRPDALNALTPPMLEALGDALDALAADSSVRVVVLTGAGRAFSAGVDLKALGQVSLDGGAVGDLLDVPARRVTGLLTSMPQIAIAKVNGGQGHGRPGRLTASRATGARIPAASRRSPRS